jgi:hypothetical protein
MASIARAFEKNLELSPVARDDHMAGRKGGISWQAILKY